MAWEGGGQEVLKQVEKELLGFTGDLGKSPPLSLVSESPLLAISKNTVQSSGMLTKGG